MSYEAFDDATLGFTTRQLHAGYDPAEHNRSKAVPIYQTAAFELGDYDRCVRLFDYSEEGHSYVRFSNPTNTVLERRIASLEGGTAAVSFASGMAAISGTLFNICQQGDEIVAVKTLYGGSTSLLESVLPDYGITCRWVEDEDDPASFEAAITDRTRAVYIECLGNPGMNIIDIQAVADIAHAHGVPLVIDNTFATPYLLRPFEFGADIVCYSATKYLAGHGTIIAGLVVEDGGFDWLNGKFPAFTRFHEEMRGSIGEETLGREMFTKRLRMRSLTDFGGHMSPMNAFFLLQGMETLSLRMERHVANAQCVAEFLEAHPLVERVNYPGLASSRYHGLAERYFPKGAGAILSADIAGGKRAALALLEHLRVFDYMVNVGDAKSLAVHPASSTHFSQSAEEQAAAGVHENTLRFSVGIEDVEDLVGDLEQALDHIK
ncbi:MAG: O-acetylhomoserine aminocarboxypropyltransferase/cysteine synthase family protein [Collinsella sp.]|nr:O-acetylhomoserine aminocarboxypropyltransferase/cysteine synthase family protein [Collinsella sp.]